MSNQLDDDVEVDAGSGQHQLIRLSCRLIGQANANAINAERRWLRVHATGLPSFLSSHNCLSSPAACCLPRLLPAATRLLLPRAASWLQRCEQPDSV